MGSESNFRASIVATGSGSRKDGSRHVRQRRLVPLPDGIELEADAAYARWIQDDRRAEAEELSELDLVRRFPLSDWQVE
jgi:hypothetical protein